MPPPFPFRPSAKHHKPKKRRLAGELNKIEAKRKAQEEKKEKEAEEARADQPFVQLLACLRQSSKPHKQVSDHEGDGDSASDEEEQQNTDYVDEESEMDEKDEPEPSEEKPLDASIDQYLTSDDDSGDESDANEKDELIDTKQAFNSHIDIEVPQKVSKTSPIPGFCKSMGDFDIKNRLPSLPSVDTNFPSSMSKVKIKSLLKAHALDDLSGATSDSSKQFRIDCLTLLLQYVDLLYLKRTSKNSNDLRKSYCLHILNHLLNVRDTILKNNSKIEKLKQEKKQIEDLEFRDQGFTRARVLILLPFRHSALEVVTCLATSLFGYGVKLGSVCRQWNRFIEEFSLRDEEPSYSKKPQDFIETFAGNIDDSFRIGLAVTKKSLKLYTDFRSSDIIICSPLSLRMMIKDEKSNFDYLSSIEIFVLDQTEVLLMQNWEHVIEVARALNQVPKESGGIDFSRIRLPLLDGNSSYYRQNIFIGSSYVNEVISLFAKYSKNLAGQVAFVNQVSPEDSAISKIFVKCSQNFVQHKCNSLVNCAERRFQFFKEQIVPKLHHEEHTMVFISSYFDFVRIRNFLKEQEINYVSLCEYTKEGKIAQARSLFFHGSRKILLCTERFHFFHRVAIKGVERVYFYQLPSQPHFYAQVCNFLTPQMQGKKFTGEEDTFAAEVIFCPLDGHRVTNVLGNQLAKKVLSKKQFKLKS